MEKIQPQIVKGIAEIAERKIQTLVNHWKNLFEPEIGVDHMQTLLDHVSVFFDEIIQETKERELTIRERIDNLNREKLDLMRLLKEDADEVLTSNVPLHTIQKNIDESLTSLRNKLTSRRAEIELLLKEQEEICDDIDEVHRPLVSDPLPSEMDMQNFRNYLEAIKEERYSRYAKILQVREEIKQLMARLEITSLNQYDNDLVSCCEMKPTGHNIEKLEHLHEVFVSQFNKMKLQIEDMRKRLEKLWKYLEIPESHQRKFLKYTGVTQTTYDELLQEVKRCEQIKKDNIRIFIEKVRMEIEEYWEKCLKSDAERLRFPSYTTNTFNEDVLELHEDELRDLKTFYENNEVIFSLIHERQELWNQMELLQNKEADPKRYNNRGGQLLKEEKERKMITVKMPLIEKKLSELVEKYEIENNRQFTMRGVPILDIIDRDYEAKRQEKLTKSGKKIQSTPARTPGRGNMTGIHRTPLTVEQTIINRTALKTTGGRLRIAAQAKQVLSTTTSSTASSVRSIRTDTGKRRMPQQNENGPQSKQAKRQLLGAFGASPANPNVFRPLQPLAAGKKLPVTKNTSIKVYNVGSCIKRRSRKSNQGKSRRSSVQRTRRNSRAVPEIRLDSPEHTITERDATSYEGFENYVYQSKSVVRSSEVARPHYLPVNHHGFASPVVKKATPARTPAGKRIGTPSASTPTARGIQPKELEFSMII